MPCLIRRAARIAKNTSSPLLDLPPELRLMIYACTYDLHVEQFQNSSNVKDLEPTSLLQVNRQIRFEAAPQFDEWFRVCGRDLGQAASRYLEECKVPCKELDNSDDEAWVQLYRARLASVRARIHTVKCTLVVIARCATRAGSLTERRLRKLVESLDNLNEEMERVGAKIEEVAQLVEASRA